MSVLGIIGCVILCVIVLVAAVLGLSFLFRDWTH